MNSTPVRTPQTPPVIQPVSISYSRPKWSVMIPAYNCIWYLKEAMESVLIQALPEEVMQIEVVDDCSSDGDIEQLVRETGKGRISYFRQEKNSGSLRNFETCIKRAKGEYIHILHGDDKVKPGFYKEIEAMFKQHPSAGATFCDFEYIDNKSRILYTDKPLLKKSGILPDWLERIAVGQRIQPPSMVIKRSVYEHLGSYFAVHYGEDWEMYVRIAANYPVAHSVKYLAQYRVHGSNITSQSMISGQNVKDIAKVISIIKNYLPEEKQKHLNRLARKHFSIYFASITDKIYHEYKDPRAAIKQAYLALRLHLNPITLKYLAKVGVKCLIRYKAS